MILRLVSSFAALPLFFVVIYFLPPIALPIAMALLCVLAVCELLWQTGAVRDLRYVVSAGVFGALLPFWAYFGFAVLPLMTALFIFAVLLFCFWLKDEKKSSFQTVCMTVFCAVIPPLALSTIVGIHQMPHGNVLIILPFIGAWITDTGAYFTGVFCGKHRLAPRISPKKTVEGAIGGVVLCVVAMLYYAYLSTTYFGLALPYGIMAVGGLVLSVLGQVGDLSLSIIKREYTIKDYGTIMPGHGGILDRFDSVLFTAPATFLALQWMALL